MNIFFSKNYEHYRDKKNPNSYPQRFLKWIYTYQSNPGYIRQVKITRVGQYDFQEIPDSLRDRGIDTSDLKFISVAIANNKTAPIYEASDCKWIEWKQSLNDEGINVVFLCEEELKETCQKKMQ